MSVPTLSFRHLPHLDGIRLLLKSLGPGVITGAADDDPSGIGLAKLIARTVQFGPVEPFFPAYPLSIEAMSSRGEARPSGLVEKKTL